MTHFDGPTQIVHLKPIKSADRYLYHYTRADTAIHYILATGTLRMSPFTAVNDPWESKHWFVEALFDETREAAAALDFMERTRPGFGLGCILACQSLSFEREGPRSTVDAQVPDLAPRKLKLIRPHPE
jgi:hypothetical protein